LASFAVVVVRSWQSSSVSHLHLYRSATHRSEAGLVSGELSLAVAGEAGEDDASVAGDEPKVVPWEAARSRYFDWVPKQKTDSSADSEWGQDVHFA